jgi:hypothetical protein
MTFALALLLNAAATSLDQLWLLRAGRDIGVLTPEYLDPGLHHGIEGAPCAEEAGLRDRLRQIGRQMRAVGSPAVVDAVLRAPLGERRRAALLALAGGGDWRVGAMLPGQVELQVRPAADGQVYLLATHPDRGASHAPHAICDHVQRLWVLPAGHPCATGRDLPVSAPDLLLESGPDSLSIDAALRDLGLARSDTGEAPQRPVCPLPAARPAQASPAAA